jgi:hypothetical protein
MAWRSVSELFLALPFRAEPLRDQIFRAARDDEFLRSRAERRERERFVVDAEDGLGIIDCDLRANRSSRAIC